MPINNYVGQAPITEQQDNIKPQPEAQYNPVQISPDLTEARALNNIANNLNKIAQTAKAINDYNDETRILTDVIKINNQALQEKWTPDQYQKQLQNYLSKIKFDNPELQAQVTRKIDMLSVDTATKLTAIHTQLIAQQTLANLDEMSQHLLNNVSDEKSYMQSLAIFEGALQDAVDKKILNPLQVQKLKDNFRKQALNNLMMTKMQASPDEYIKDLRSGVYDGILSESEKLKAIQMAKEYKLRNEQQVLEQIKLQRSILTYNYLDKLSKGEIDIVTLMKSNLPADVKQRILNVYNNNVVNSPDTWKNYGEIAQNIIQGKYNNLHDLQDDMLKSSLPRGMFLQLQNMYLTKMAHQITENGISFNKVFSNPLVKSQLKVLDSQIKTVFLQKYVGMIGSTEQQRQQMADLSNRAVMRFNYELTNCLSHDNEVNCLNQLDKFRMEAMSSVLGLYDMNYFIEKNNKVFNSMNLIYKSGEGLFSTYKQVKVPDELKNFVVEKLYEIAKNEKLNPMSDYGVDHIITDKIPITFNLTQSAQKKYGVAFLRAYITYDHGTVNLIPINEKLWRKVYGE